MLSAFSVSLILIGAGLLSMLSLSVYSHLAGRWRLVAIADSDRHLHTGTIPTGAGVAFLWPVAVFLCACGLIIAWSAHETVWRSWGQALGLASLLVTGYLDDRGGLPATLRLLIQAGAVLGLLLLARPALQAAGYGLPWLLLFAIGGLWWHNLFNFMDGANGMAGWHVVVSGIFYAIAWWGASGWTCPLILVLLLVVCTGVFLFWNFPNARLFMGDAGSLGLAWLIFSLAIWGMLRHVFDPTFVLLLHSPFVVDATLTLWRRWHEGERLGTAHKQHVYQRLITVGARHSVVSLGYAAVTAGGGLLALVSRYWSPADRWLAAAVWIAILLAGWFFLWHLTQNKIFMCRSED